MLLSVAAVVTDSVLFAEAVLLSVAAVVPDAVLSSGAVPLSEQCVCLLQL